MARTTAQRQAIQAVFEYSGRPMGPYEVLGAARSGLPALGIATVYRAIKDLVEEHWLVSVNLPGEPARYERAGKKHHHHFHCSHCKRVFEAQGCRLALDKLVPRGFTLTAHELVLYGLCATCLAVEQPQVDA